MEKKKYKLSQEGMEELMMRLAKRARELNVDISEKELLQGIRQENDGNVKLFNEPKKEGN